MTGTTFNPVTSPLAKKVETREDGLVIYSHRSKFVAGAFLLAKDGDNWVAFETLAEARDSDGEDLR